MNQLDQSAAPHHALRFKQSSLKRGAMLCLLWLSVSGLLTGARLSHPAFGLQGDLPSHYHLLRAFVQELTDGTLWPRWASLFDGGRGDAFFTFYPPLCYLLGALLIKLGGMSILAALKIITLLIPFLGQASAYLFARLFFAHRQSLIVALSYVLLPAYSLITLHRAFLANGLALSLAPLALLGAHLILSGIRRRAGWMIFTLSFSLIILTHVITTYLCALAIGLLVLIRLPQVGWRGVARLAGAVGSAFALTAFFFWPQLIEMQWVQINLQTVQQDYRNYFSYRQAWAGLNTVASFITLAQTGLALLLSGLCWRRLSSKQWRSERSTIIWFSLAVVALGLFLALPLSAFCWQYLPGLKFVQFPWRWQPFAALGCGLLAAAAWGEWPTLGRRLRVALMAATTWLIITNIILTISIARLREPSITRAQVDATLNATMLPTLTVAEGRQLQNENNLEFLPYVANQVYFRPHGADLNLYSPNAQPGGLTILDGRGRAITRELRGWRREFLIEADEPLHTRLETYRYPHWLVRLDGHELPTVAEPGSGLMLLDLPAGTHTLTLTFEVRSTTEWIARLISLATVLVIGWVFWRRNR
jgi:hypothetical protein